MPEILPAPTLLAPDESHSTTLHYSNGNVVVVTIKAGEVVPNAIVTHIRDRQAAGVFIQDQIELYEGRGYVRIADRGSRRGF